MPYFIIDDTFCLGFKRNTLRILVTNIIQIRLHQYGFCKQMVKDTPLQFVLLVFI